jgi:quercetin 2,3-dioxygenase
MIKVREGASRGHTEIGWLDSWHTFSFGDYYDPAWQGFRALRVINDDRVAPGKGFGTHGHRDMEIVSYVLSGALEHRDNIGTTSVIRPGEVQRMSAGTGVMHSEYNGSKSEAVHFLQIWIVPERRGLAPSYEQKTLPLEERRGRFRLLGAREAREGAIVIHQDVSLYGAVLAAGEEASMELASGRHAWVHVVNGDLSLGDARLGTGDGAAISDEPKIHFSARGPSEIILFDLA